MTHETPKRLICIGGIERSGTTVLATWLSSQFVSTTLPESQWKIELAAQLPENPNWVLDPSANLRYRIWGAKEQIGPFPDSTPRGALWQIVEDLERRNKVGSSRVYLDHTPDNIANARILMQSYDPLGFLHIYRSPVAVLSSIMATDWGYPSLRSALRYYLTRQQATSEGLDFLRRHHPERLIEISYEDFCSSPNGVVDQIVQRFSLADFCKSGVSKVFIPAYTTSQHTKILETPKLVTKPPSGWGQAELSLVDASVRSAKLEQLSGFGIRRIAFELRELVRTSRKFSARFRLIQRRRMIGMHVRAIKVSKTLERIRHGNG